MEKGQAYWMNGGEGPYSYARNSSYQREIVVGVKSMIGDVVYNKLDINEFPSVYPNSGGTIRIADFGCSTGPNTLIAMQYIVEAIQQKHPETIEFQVFFNDHVQNDFNTLFRTLHASGQQYFGSGVPGSFYDRLFPKATLHIGFASCSVHWLSRVPEEVLDKNSLAWNKGRIYYAGNPMVLKAYGAQHKKDLDIFLSLRAEEMVAGGLFLLTLPNCPQVNGVKTAKTLGAIKMELLASCLMDMGKMGMISEEKVDSFNLPFYFTSISELTEVVEANGFFSIEMMESIPAEPHFSTSHIRASTEELFQQHFGSHIVDHLFDLYAKKVAQISTSDIETTFTIFACLKAQNLVS